MNNYRLTKSCSRRLFNTRTAVRFSKNVNYALDSFRSDLSNIRMNLDLFRNLGADTTSVESLYERTLGKLGEFPSQGVSSSESLVSAYQALHREMGLLSSRVAQLSDQTNRTFQVQTRDCGHVCIFAPRSIRTTAPGYAAVLVKPESSVTSSIKCTVQGVLLQLPQDAVLSTNQRGQAEHAVTNISFVGQRGGKGSLALVIEEPPEMREKIAFEVWVQPSAVESARDAAVLGTPVGGVGIWLLWYITGDIQIAAPLG